MKLDASIATLRSLNFFGCDCYNQINNNARIDLLNEGEPFIFIGTASRLVPSWTFCQKASIHGNFLEKKLNISFPISFVCIIILFAITINTKYN